jgi:hypothetical protein
MIAEATPGQLKASVGAGVMDVRLREFDQRSQAPRTLSHPLDVPVALESDPNALSPQGPRPQGDHVRAGGAAVHGHDRRP